MENLVSTQWLADHLGAKDIAILDCSWHLPSANRHAKAEFLEAHIPGAQFFDIDQHSDQNSSLPHMLPSPEQFASAMKKLGIGNDTSVICYDTVGLFSAARVWWSLRYFGHARTAVLDGGLLKWRAENRPLAKGEPQAPETSPFLVQPALVKVSSLAEVKQASQIADARSPARFRGEEAEPRPTVRPGHIPGSRNVHYASLLNPDGTLKSAADLYTVFKTAGLDVQKPITTSCGSGVTAAIISLALAQITHPNHSLYDGSWTEWGSSTEPIATGPA